MSLPDGFDEFVNQEDGDGRKPSVGAVNKCICKLESKYDNSPDTVGTGFFVKHKSKVFILTAAHNLNRTKSIKVISNDNSNIEVLPQNMRVSLNYIPTPEGEDDKPSSNDYGIILLNGIQSDSFQFLIPTDREILTNDISITGYPIDLGNGLQPFVATGKASNIESNLISYTYTKKRNKFCSQNQPRYAN